MPRGKDSKVGDTRTSNNGYHYTKTEERWRLTHHLIAEQTLGRPLAQGERVAFKDKNKNNLKPSNLIVTKIGSGSVKRRRAQIAARIQELAAQLDELR